VSRILVVGLGNPRAEYRNTRHNVGFQVIDLLCRRSQKELRPGKGEYHIAWVSVDGNEVGLVQPLTYMNRSGEAVVDAMRQCEVSPEGLLVVCDDIMLPLGSLRIRSRGSDGGHNGLSSIIYHLQTEAVPRLRCGIRKKQMPPQDMADFVLSPFDADEERSVREMIARAGEACIEVVAAGLARAMNRFNT